MCHSERMHIHAGVTAPLTPSSPSATTATSCTSNEFARTHSRIKRTERQKQRIDKKRTHAHCRTLRSNKSDPCTCLAAGRSRPPFPSIGRLRVRTKHIHGCLGHHTLHHCHQALTY
ncbi:hypothetical protein TbgDal_XI5070 [Trypanosoma brucei gambiense DAL972]|uniref:Uncharacterized protein n=1 Tax=Trypanosoma brucei gambiense (strain MHOM/CI/86/DAL972) TaxID=679716 RepID=D0A6T8_TRYB9|nr:hypothetical protein TbgDal_XI5070 [Trypanosoma brucei gambiense DAL972]CBH17389.1 hypothetical protein TbgDal_XI5070 [Trypanosoma brucei gambiense DAL972]|eukprot:XP_011779653.1 hypothetical protein TbgDal_XI5070 [Trypanosoma brucei gambiense DAL972]